MALCALALLLFAAVSSIAAAGHDDSEPMPEWRLSLVRQSRWIGRFIVMTLGFSLQLKGWQHYLEARRAGVKLIVFNHPSWVDTVIVLSLFAPSGVSREANKHIPVVGTIIKSFQNIYVPTRSRKRPNNTGGAPLVLPSATELMTKRLRESGWPMLAIAPEGMTSNGRALLQFRSGAFVHLVPVLPVCISYKWQHVNPGWTIGYEPWHILRLLAQFVNYAQVTILPAQDVNNVARASAVGGVSRQEDVTPVMYREHVRQRMAEALSVPLVDAGIPDYHALYETGVTVDWKGDLCDPRHAVDSNGRVEVHLS